MHSRNLCTSVYLREGVEANLIELEVSQMEMVVLQKVELMHNCF